MPATIVGYIYSPSGTGVEPSGVVAGDRVYACAFNTANTTVPSLPSGWSAQGSDSTSVAGAYRGANIARGASAPSYAFTNATAVAVLAIRPDNSGGIFGASDAVISTGSSYASPSLPSINNPSIVVALCLTDATRHITGVPAGFTELSDATATNIMASYCDVASTSQSSVTTTINGGSAGFAVIVSIPYRTAVEVDLTLSAGGASTTAAQLKSPVRMPVAASGIATAVSQIKSPVRLPVTAAGASTAAAQVRSPVRLPVSAAGLSTAAIAKLFAPFQLGPLSAAGVATANLLLSTPGLHINAAGSSTAAAILSAAQQLTLSADGVATATGHLISPEQLSLGADGAATADAVLTAHMRVLLAITADGAATTAMALSAPFQLGALLASGDAAATVRLSAAIRMALASGGDSTALLTLLAGIPSLWQPPIAIGRVSQPPPAHGYATITPGARARVSQPPPAIGRTP